ncbi:MAG: universal stress protein [Thaumarchaeota archaeon]|nr:universal stress protein [Nitrososphaerota archaeon]MDE1867316.1 universal stress protein [Nitrososphaerota archaeon]
MIKHIMVPYDKSEPASRALEYAIDIAKKFNSDISVVACVIPHIPMDPSFGTAYVETLKLMRQSAANATSTIKSRLDELNIPVKTVILEGISATDELVSFAESHKIDLIVMGSRGLGGFKKLLLGSVASGVSQHSKCPVLIVK